MAARAAATNRRTSLIIPSGTGYRASHHLGLRSCARERIPALECVARIPGLGAPGLSNDRSSWALVAYLRLIDTSIPVPTVLAPTIRTPAVPYKVGTDFRERGTVALANLCSAHHKRSEDFGGHRVVGIMVGCSTLELIAHADLHRSLEDGTPATGAVNPKAASSPAGISDSRLRDGSPPLGADARARAHDPILPSAEPIPTSPSRRSDLPGLSLRDSSQRTSRRECSCQRGRQHDRIPQRRHREAAAPSSGMERGMRSVSHQAPNGTPPERRAPG